MLVGCLLGLDEALGSTPNTAKSENKTQIKKLLSFETAAVAVGGGGARPGESARQVAHWACRWIPQKPESVQVGEWQGNLSLATPPPFPPPRGGAVKRGKAQPEQ